MKPTIKLSTQFSAATIIMVLAASPASANWFTDKFQPKNVESGQGKIIDKTKKSTPQAKAAPKSKPAKKTPVKAIKKDKKGNWFKRTFKRDKAKVEKKVARNSAPKVANKPAKKAGRDILLIDNLTGIAILGKPGQIKPEGFDFNLNGIKHMDKSVVLPKSVKKVMNSYIGKPLTLNGLSEMNKSLMKAYSDAKIQISTVIAPEQEITRGGIQLLIINGRLGETKLIGNKYFKDGLYLKHFTTKKNEIIKSDKIVEDLRYMNRNPFRRVDLVYTPGRGYGRTDITLRATETKPQTFYAGVNNSGTKLLGTERYFVGGQFGNLFDKDHQISFQYTTNYKSGTDLDAFFTEYRIPLANRQELRFNAAKTKYKAKINALDIEGDSTIFGADYYKSAPRFANFGGDFHVGIKQKESNNETAFSVGDNDPRLLARVAVGGKKYKYTELAVGWEGERLNTGSRTSVSANLIHDSGDVTEVTTGASSDVQFSAIRANARHVKDFSNDTRLTVAGKLQIASNSNLPSNEEFFLGGNGSVRGFAPSVTKDPNGLTVNTTYRGKNLLEKNKKLLGHQIRPYGFVDVGLGYTRSPSVGELGGKSKQIASAGLGVTYNYGRNATVDLSYGAQLVDDNLDTDSGYFHANATVRY